MVSVNKKTQGVPCEKINLRRLVLNCLLWENTFYETGENIADLIVKEALKTSTDINALASLAIEARTDFNLRRVPLLLLSCLAMRGSGNSIVSETIYKTILRADEIAEFLAIHAKLNGVCSVNGLKKVLSKQVKKGIGMSFNRFNEYQFGKYFSNNKSVTMKDALFLCHPKPKDYAQSQLFYKIKTGTLESPFTWENELYLGKDKCETFTKLLEEKKLPSMALLKNLKNMVESKVSESLIKQAIVDMDVSKILPFRFIKAAEYAPHLEQEIDIAFQKSIENLPKLSGMTVILVDVSGSMNSRISNKSELTRADAACALAVMVRSENKRVFSFSKDVVECPHRNGMSGIDAIRKSQNNSSTYLKKAIDHVNAKVAYDRIIVITDEESNDGFSNPLSGKKGYMINVASSENKLSSNVWERLNGFSENVLRFIEEIEK